MLKYKFKVGDGSINIPLNVTFDVADKEEAIRDYYIEEQIKKVVPPQQDYEVTKYFPTAVDEILIKLYKEDHVPFTYKDFGFTDSDIELFYNRLSNSFFTLNYYTQPNKLQRDLVYRVDLFVQRVNLFDGNNIKLAEDCEVIFKIKNPRYFFNETEGFFVYLKNNEYEAPFSLYMNFKFNNALNGTSYLLYPHKNLNVLDVVEADEYVKIDFNPIVNTFIFNTGGNTIEYTPQGLTLNLYALIV
jgi:hypothetical protein